MKKEKTYVEIPFNTIAYDYKHGNRFYLTKSTKLSNEKYEQYTNKQFIPKTLDEVYYYIKFKGANAFNSIASKLNLLETNIIKRLNIKNKHEDIWFDTSEYQNAFSETVKDISSLLKIVNFDVKKIDIPKLIHSSNKVCFKRIKDDLDKLKNILAEKSNFNILIGEPGTGKTTSAIELIKKYGEDVTVISLSNLVGANFKARFEKTCDNIKCEFESYTKARFLPSYSKTVVFEEASMLSSNELGIILNFIDYADNVIFCGDTNQLPGFLGLGNILYGLITEYPKNVIKLIKNHRCSEDVVETMHQIIDNGTFPTPSLVDYKTADKIYKKMLVDNDNVIQISFANEIVKRLNEKAIDSLTTYHNSDFYAKIDDILSNGIKIPLRSNSNMKVLRNDEYEYLFYNGEMCSLSKVNGEYCVSSNMFKNHFNAYDTLYELFESFDLGYAMSVHKSQGLEFDYVFYYEAENTYYETRNLCYVGYTRSRKRSYIIAPQNTIKKQITYKNIFR